MDTYASLLMRRNEFSELNRLAHECLSTDLCRPETWAVASMYWKTRKDKARALKYAEKGIEMNDRHLACYILKGYLALDLQKPEMAVPAFRKCLRIQAEWDAYKGLVRAYLMYPNTEKQKQREAMSMAKQALRAFPSTARALSLSAEVYAAVGEVDKACKMFESALRVDPHYTEAVTCLAQLYSRMGRVEDAIEMMDNHMRVSTTASLHVKMGTLLSIGKRFDKAMEHFQLALSMAPGDEEATAGLERMEKLMKGTDVDVGLLANAAMQGYSSDDYELPI
mmetsp:Transcript_9549/g.34997  ORF Transcript_9549/g.34997 Transcript_9549/m.34997 type:complete len:280 (-) Transcript_9549:68-907(-)